MLKINFGLCLIIACIALSMAAPRRKNKAKKRMLEIPIEGENPFNAMLVENGENTGSFPVEPEQPQGPEVTLGEIIFRPNPKLFNIPMIGHPVGIVGPHPGPMAIVGTGDFHVTGAEIVDAKKKRRSFRKIFLIQ